MKKSIIAGIFGMMFIGSVVAQDVVITSGKAGGTYNGVFGVNLAGAMSEFGYRPQLQPSKQKLRRQHHRAFARCVAGVFPVTGKRLGYACDAVSDRQPQPTIESSRRRL